MVAINPAPVSLCKELLAGTSVHVGAAVGFLLGQVAVLKNNLRDHPCTAAFLYNTGHLMLNKIVVFFFQLRNVDNIIDLIRAIGDCIYGFVFLDLGRTLPQGETNRTRNERNVLS